MLMPAQSLALPPRYGYPIKNRAAEIDVFDAWKYFNDTPKMSLPNQHHRHKLKKDVVPPQQQHLTKTSKKSFFASIGCNCSCLTIRGNKGKQERQRRSQFGSPIPIKGTMLTWGDEHSDTDSDASSDLFEIQSFYTDNPFETSIEWSVVTSSALDFSPILTPCIIKSGFNAKTASFREMPNILSGCNTHKAVSVAGDAHTRRRPITKPT